MGRRKESSNTGHTNKIIEKKININVDSLQYLLKGLNLKCRNKKQKEFIQSIDDNKITFCVGNSGTGKSYMSLIKGLEMMKNGLYKKMFIITPIVEIENESIGLLKGDLSQKTSVYLYSIYYLIDEIVGKNIREKLVEYEYIVPLYISYLRGVNLQNCVTIVDETQNITHKGMVTLLTRFGKNSKFIISGDLDQIDKFKNKDDSGLKWAWEKLKGTNDIGFIEFGRSEIVRDPIIGDILDKLVLP